MNIKSHQEYFLTINDRDLVLSSFDAMVENLNKSISAEKGKISFSANDGIRPWWHRFFFGLKIYIRSYFAVEWSGEIAGLIFYDENASESRCLAPEVQKVSEQVRKEISFGEDSPLEDKYCLAKNKAMEAITLFLDNEHKPGWIEYEFVE